MARVTHQVAVAKLETTYGTDIVPVASLAADVVLCDTCTISGFEAQIAERARLVPWHGNRGRPGAYARSVQISPEVSLCGSGTAGTVPAWGKLMRMCGMAEVITASTKVDYAPISASQESGTFYHFLDGTRHRALGARGSFVFNLAAGDEPKIAFNFTGLYSDPTAVALPSATYTAWRDALVPRSGITTFSIGGNNYPLRMLRYTHGNSLAVRDIPQKYEVRITDRQPTMEVTIEAPDAIAPANFFALANAETEMAVIATHGIAAGDIIELRASQARLMPGVKYDRDGDVAMLTMTFMPRPSAGNDEVLITAR
jgi:hypothetical protein